MLEAVKMALRIKTDAFDDELNGLIAACMADLGLSGVKTDNTDDPLIVRAVIVYCKAYFGSNPDAVQYEQSYQALKISLSLAGDYRA